MVTREQDVIAAVSNHDILRVGGSVERVAVDILPIHRVAVVKHILVVVSNVQPTRLAVGVVDGHKAVFSVDQQRACRKRAQVKSFDITYSASRNKGIHIAVVNNCNGTTNEGHGGRHGGGIK